MNKLQLSDIVQQRKDRGFRARRAGIWGIVYQFVYAVAQLVVMGVLARYLGPEQFGLWMTVLALTTWMPLANLGQNSVLLTKMGGIALTDHVASQRVFTASAFLVTAITVVLVIPLLATGPYFPWAEMLNGKDAMTDSEIGILVVAVLLVSLLAIPASLGASSVFASQRGDIVHMVMSMGSLFSLGLVGIGVWLKGPLWLIGSIAVSGPLLGGLTLWAQGLSNGMVPIPKLSALDPNAVRSAMKVGATFLFVDLTTLLLMRTPDVIVAHLQGVAAVGAFASVGRLPLLMMALFQALLLPFWPAIGEAANRGDLDWIRRMTKYTLLLILGIWAAGAAGMWTLGAFFIELWMGSADFANSDLIRAACAQSLGLGLFAWISILLSALSRQRLLVMISGLTALIFLPLAFFCGDRYGPVGVALAQAGALLFCAVPLGGLVLHRIIANKTPVALAT